MLFMQGLRIFYTQDKVTFVYCILWPVLFVLSGVYWFFLLCREFLYRAGVLTAYRPALKVISIGNVTLGGTGKTPFAQLIAGKLVRNSHRPAILLRGYKKPREDKGAGTSQYYALGDEAGMLQSQNASVKVVSGIDRVGIARKLEEEGVVDTIILDDGFQHFRMKRDLDIVMVDATKVFGNGCVLPLGPLREGLSALKRADCFCLTRIDEVSGDKVGGIEVLLLRFNPAASILSALHAPQGLVDLRTARTLSIDGIKGEDVCLLCGIANPFSFEHTTKKLGGKPVLKFFFQDHHEYSEADIAFLVRQCKESGINKIVTTEKDVQRLAVLVSDKDWGVDFIVLKVALKMVKGEEVLDARLRALYCF